jgi:hypothetical protein
MSFDRENPGDAEFERTLLESARKDTPPHSVQDAWARFAGALSLIAPSLAPDSDLGGPRVSADRTSAGTVAKAAGARAVRAAVIQWLLLGAIGGSAVTAAVMVPRREGKPDSPKPVLYRESPAPAKPAASVRSPMPVPFPADERTATSAPQTASPVALSRRLGRGRDRSIQHQPRSSGLAEAVSSGDSKDQTINPLRVDSSTLSAEVARIDAARTAISGGDYDEALRLIERYHRDFPTGALAPDADVVALEAVAAKGDRAEVRRRAHLFLSRYPGDPQAARVKWLAAPRSE